VLRAGNAETHASLLGSRDDVPSILRSFDLFALSSRVEGISNTILEAMATGLPVVAPRVGGNEELVEDGVEGSLVPSRDPDALAEALSRYVVDEKLRVERGRAARLRAEREFGLDGMIARYVAVYDGLCSQADLRRKERLQCAG
jgi:glycosyltransferase involved in cell wall biosynthesis